VVSEVAPWSQTGGLADVAGALPPALRAADPTLSVLVVTPLYRTVRDAWSARLDLADGGQVDVDVGGRRTARLLVARGEASTTCFVDLPEFYDRSGLYGDGRSDFPDNSLRFAALNRVALAVAPRLLGGVPDILHCHDWQAGLGPLVARRELPPQQEPRAVVFTVHNLAYQGLFPRSAMSELGLDWSLFTPDNLEFHDQVSFLKAGIKFAEATTTVSPGYARAILEPELGCGLDGFLRRYARRLRGIVNGIDVTSWNPATDPQLAASYSADDPDGKARCRQALADELGSRVGAGELWLGAITRLVEQKGVDLITALIPRLSELGARLVVLGTGDGELEHRLLEAAARSGAGPEKSRCVVRLGFDVALARRIYAGVDALLMPSRFEPCGLNQLYAMRYGTVPIVRRVGGLADTVDDPGDEALAAGRGTGFCFDRDSIDDLYGAVHRATKLFGDRAGWSRLVASAMGRDWSWNASAGAYVQLYRELLAETQ
jgi:starch synthase